MLELGGDTKKLTNLVGGKRKGDKHSMDNHNLEEEAKESVSKRRYMYILHATRGMPTSLSFIANEI